MKQLYDNIYVAGQLTPEDFPAMAEAGIKVIINNRPDHEESGQLDHHSAAELAERHDMNYHYLPMANGQPLPPDLVEQFAALTADKTQPVLAHCRSGMRSSFLWALGRIAAGEITADQAISAANGAGIPLQSARPVLESVTPRG